MATTETQTAPEIKIFHRIHSIPLIASSIDTLDNSLSSYSLTRSPYSTAKGLSSTAMKYAQPLQARLAPLIVVADGYANKAVDVVESRYPYPFRARPEEVAEYVRQRRTSASSYVKQRKENVQHTVDDTVHNVAYGLDQQLAPLVNAFEAAVTKLTDATPPPSTENQTQYQYQRALALSKTLTTNLYEKSKQLQESNVVLHRITEAAHTLGALAASAHMRIHSLSDTMIADLKYLSDGLATDLKNLSADVGAMAQELTSEAPLNEKANKIKERVAPVIDKLKELVHGLAKRGEDIVRTHHAAAPAKDAPEKDQTAENGNANDQDNDAHS